jgi:hypothetical protein
MVRRRTIVPALEICSVNCLNWDVYQKCPIFLKGRLCSSWRPRDLGDGDEVLEEVPFVRESLGSVEENIKTTSTKITEPVDEADSEREGEEEEVEVDAGNN